MLILIILRLNVKGNNFQNTEGEVWLAAALERNPSLNLDTAAWPAEEMYADGYYLLAAMRGVSASGATIEPQRVDSLLYCLFLIFGDMPSSNFWENNFSWRRVTNRCDANDRILIL